MKAIHKQISIIMMLFFNHSMFAQNNGSITGTLKDSQTQEPISFANIVLSEKSTKNVIKTSQTDLNGVFLMEKLPPATYSLLISFVGYESVKKDSISISPTNINWNLGNINIGISKNNLLNEITVNGKKATLQIGDEKKVFLVNQSLISVGGTAADVLQNVPTLQIDVNGNVSLRGSTNVKVWVDGKPSLIGGGDIAQVLQTIPANTIEKIEVIANPSAKYNAEGSGIIHIITKKNSKLGFNGATALIIGSRENVNVNANLSFQNKRLNIYSNYSYQYGYTYSNGYQNITYIKSRQITGFSNENFPSTTLNKGHIIKTGIDYSLSEKSFLSFTSNLNFRESIKNEFLNIDILNAAYSPKQLSFHDITIDGSGNTYDFNVDFNQKFRKPDKELNLSLSFAKGTNDNFNIYTSDVYNRNNQAVDTELGILQNNFKNYNTNYNLQADYTLPIRKTGKIETGFRSQIALADRYQWGFNFNHNTNLYDLNYSLANTFINFNQIHALYLTFQNQIKNFGYQVGLRAENAHLEATSESYDTNNQLYKTPIEVISKGLYPSVFLTQQFKNEQKLQLSYVRRINRPVAREVNPFLDISDPVNFDTGNPKILPEDRQSVQLSYSKLWENTSLSSSLYYNQINNVIKRIETEPVNGVITTISQNLKRAVNSGLELIGHFNISKAWDFTANTNFYYRKNDATPLYGIRATKGFSWNVNLTQNFNLVKGFSVQIRTDYRAKDVLIQDKSRAVFGVDAGAKYDFSNKKATLSFSSRDIFYSRWWRFLRESDSVLLDFGRRTQSARFSLTFTYRFGKTTFETKKTKRIEDVATKRIDSSN